LLQLRTKLSLNYAFAQHPETNAESLGTFFVLETTMGLTSVGIVLAATPVLVALGYARIIVTICMVMALISFTESVTSVLGVTLDKALRFKPMSVVQLIAFPLSYVPAFVLALNGAGAWCLVAQMAAYSVFLQLSGLIVVRARMPEIFSIKWRFDRLLAKRFLQFGTMTGMGIFAGSLMMTLDNFLVGTFAGTSMLGYYDRAYRTAQWPAVLLNSISARVSFFTYARLQDLPQQLERAVTMMLWLITVVTLPIGLVLIVAAPDLISALYGERWLPSTNFVRLLATYAVVRPIVENVGGLFIAIGQPRLATKVTVAQVLTLAVTGLPLTLAFGAMGTCLAVGVAVALGVAVTYQNICRIIPIEPFKILGVPLLAAALTLAGYAVANRVIALNALPLVLRTAAKVGYAAAAFYALVLIVQFRPTLERVSYIYHLMKQSRG
jgi:lipopolysaccharide exporter